MCFVTRHFATKFNCSNVSVITYCLRSYEYKVINKSVHYTTRQRRLDNKRLLALNISAMHVRRRRETVMFFLLSLSTSDALEAVIMTRRAAVTGRSTSEEGRARGEAARALPPPVPQAPPTPTLRVQPDSTPSMPCAPGPAANRIGRHCGFSNAKQNNGRSTLDKQRWCGAN